MSRSRGPLGLAAALLGAVVLLGVVAVLRGPSSVPVEAHLGSEAVRIGSVQPAIAVLVPPLLVAVVAALRACGRLPHGAVVLAAGASTPIALFLVALLNGLREAAALVLVYACSAGGLLLRSLHRPGGPPAPLRLWSVLGIVPWGLVAFTQIGAGLLGAPPPASVRVLTLVVLAAGVLEFVLAYRHRDAPRETGGLVLAALPGLLLAAGVVLLVEA